MKFACDPFALGVAIVFHLFLAPWINRHARKPRPELPSGLMTAARLLLAMGVGVLFIGLGIGICAPDLSRSARMVWVGITSVVAVLWLWNAFRLRDGLRSARWASLPFLLAGLPCLPVFG